MRSFALLAVLVGSCDYQVVRQEGDGVGDQTALVVNASEWTPVPLGIGPQDPRAPVHAEEADGGVLPVSEPDADVVHALLPPK